MSAIQAIYQRLSSDSSLAEVLPAGRIYTGVAPLRDALEQPVTPPYVTIASAAAATVSRTSSGTQVVRQTVRLSTFSKTYAEAQAIATLVDTLLTGAPLTWSGGRAVDARPAGHSETERPEDGVWHIADDIELLIVQ